MRCPHLIASIFSVRHGTSLESENGYSFFFLMFIANLFEMTKNWKEKKHHQMCISYRMGK